VAFGACATSVQPAGPGLPEAFHWRMASCASLPRSSSIWSSSWRHARSQAAQPAPGRRCRRPTALGRRVPRAAGLDQVDGPSSMRVVIAPAAWSLWPLLTGFSERNAGGADSRVRLAPFAAARRAGGGGGCAPAVAASIASVLANRPRRPRLVVGPAATPCSLASRALGRRAVAGHVAMSRPAQLAPRRNPRRSRLIIGPVFAPRSLAARAPSRRECCYLAPAEASKARTCSSF
jgi:hypothetical protein